MNRIFQPLSSSINFERLAKHMCYVSNKSSAWKRLFLAPVSADGIWFRSICIVHELSTGHFNFFFASTEDIFSSPFLIAQVYYYIQYSREPLFNLEVGRAYSTTINLFSVNLSNHDLSRIFIEKIRRMPGSASPVKITNFFLENPPRPLLRLSRTWSSGKALPV